jgi:hypothetical protein
MSTLEYDLKFLRTGIPELQDYLLSRETYWPLGLAASAGERPYPRMTLGWLLLTLVRAEEVAASVSPAPASSVASLRQQLQATRAQWLIAWQKKATQEFSARLKLWTNFLNEYRGDKINANQYAYEVQRRALLHLLLAEAAEIPSAERDLLQGLDSFLQAVLEPGPFVWEPALAPAFPQATYWYLYGSLPAK